MNKLSMKTISSLIGMISVLVMLVWGYLGSFHYSWLAVFAGGIIIRVIAMIRSDKESAA